MYALFAALILLLGIEGRRPSKNESERLLDSGERLCTPSLMMGSALEILGYNSSSEVWHNPSLRLENFDVEGPKV